MLPKELVVQARRLEIATRKDVAETFAGAYASVFKGRGMAFSEVRPYQPGDEVRTIDWNVTARMQAPYVKVFTEERELTVMLLVDRSASQGFGTVEATKDALAARIAALLAFSAIRSGDRVGAILFSDRIERFLPPKKGKRHALGLITELLRTQPEGIGTELGPALDLLGRVTRRRTIVFLLSDFLFPPAVETPLRVVAERHDLIPVVFSDPFEDRLAPLGITTVVDPETGRRVEVDLRSRGVRRRYQALREGERERRQRLFRRLRVSPIELRGGEDPVGPLAAFFEGRRGRRVR